MRIAVTGATGLLGSELCRQLGGAGIALGKARLDLTDEGRALAVLQQVQPDVVINTAAYTEVDRAQSASGEMACRSVNDDGVRRLTEACAAADCLLVHVSTDYVFGADRGRSTPYLETDSPGPLNVYGRSKLAAEGHAMLLPRHLIVRTSGLFGRPGRGGRRHFIDAMLARGAQAGRVRVVDDQRLAPSFAPHIAASILRLIAAAARGTYHVVSSGSATWHEFAEEIFRQAGMDVRVDRISSAEFAAPAVRPHYSVLDTRKYRDLGYPPLPSWREGLAEYLALVEPSLSS